MSGPSSTWTTIRVLTWTADRFAKEGLDSPRLDAELLLAFSLGVDRVRLYVDHDKPLRPEELERYRGCVRRRLAREPVAYILGEREFWSLRLRVNPHVLVPRPDTETLVERALELLGDLRDPRVVDVGTGSGAVALAIAKERPDAKVAALDISPDALCVAQENACANELKVDFHCGNLLEALPTEFTPQLVVANLPYIPSQEILTLEPEVSQWEPRCALDGGVDGLDFIKRLVEQTAHYGASIALEIGSSQGVVVGDLLRAGGCRDVAVHCDLAGCDRVVTGRF